MKHTPLRSFIRQNANYMSLTEMAIETQLPSHFIRDICNSMGVVLIPSKRKHRPNGLKKKDAPEKLFATKTMAINEPAKWFILDPRDVPIPTEGNCCCRCKEMVSHTRPGIQVLVLWEQEYVTESDEGLELICTQCWDICTAAPVEFDLTSTLPMRKLATLMLNREEMTADIVQRLNHQYQDQ